MMYEEERKALPTVALGVLAFQGAFLEHFRKLEQLASLVKDSVIVTVGLVRTAEALEDIHGLIIPGGESTTIGLFLKKNNFLERLSAWIKGGDSKPGGAVWGTCAGLILLSERIEGQKEGGQDFIGGLGVTCSRNRFGRQINSFEAKLSVKEGGLSFPVTASDDFLHSSSVDIQNHNECVGMFIRAPGIRSVDSVDVSVLATLTRGGEEEPVAVRQGRLMATTFHPELTDDLRWHLYFLKLVLNGLHPPVTLENFKY